MKRKIDLTTSIVVIILFMLTFVTFYIKRDSITSVSQIVPITKADTSEKAVAFACNVYEGNEELKRIVSVLREERVKISFFIGGVWAYRNPDMLLLLKASGQDIQNHGYYHKSPSTINNESNVSEIINTEKLISDITQQKTFLFEPPSGDFDDNSLNIVKELGYKTVTWSIDTIDWREDATKEKIMDRITKKLHPGAIILIHPKPVTADSLSDIIKMLKENGYRIMPVKDLLNLSN